MVSRSSDARDTRTSRSPVTSGFDSLPKQGQNSAASLDGPRDYPEERTNDTSTDDRSCRSGFAGRCLRRFGSVCPHQTESGAGVSFTSEPDSEAHRHLDAVAERYRTFALIAHLRKAHGLTEVVPERAAIAHDLFTQHDIALALSIAADREAP
jgi:hypothetical protein